MIKLFIFILFVRISHVVGNILQDFLCCITLLSETFLEDTWIFQIFKSFVSMHRYNMQIFAGLALMPKLTYSCGQ